MPFTFKKSKVNWLEHLKGLHGDVFDELLADKRYLNAAIGTAMANMGDGDDNGMEGYIQLEERTDATEVSLPEGYYLNKCFLIDCAATLIVVFVYVKMMFISGSTRYTDNYVGVLEANIVAQVKNARE
jgi:hypothetical protein